MRLKHLQHNEIDKAAWDNVLHKDINAQPYALSWYLDIVSPNWEAFVIESGDGYSAIFPLPVKKKWGLQYLVQPPYCNQLGFYGQYNSSDLDECILKLKKQFRRYNIVVNTNTGNSLTNKSLIINCELPLLTNYQELYNGYSVNAKRNIKKARNIQLTQMKITDFIELKSESDFGLTKYHLDILVQLHDACIAHKVDVILPCASANGENLSGGFFIAELSKIIYISGASTTKGKERRAMFAIIDSLIRRYANTGLILDFRGGNLPGTNRFFKNFGSKEIENYRLKRRF